MLETNKWNMKDVQHEIQNQKCEHWHSASNCNTFNIVILFQEIQLIHWDLWRLYFNFDVLLDVRPISDEQHDSSVEFHFTSHAMPRGILPRAWIILYR